MVDGNFHFRAFFKYKRTLSNTEQFHVTRITGAVFNSSLLFASFARLEEGFATEEMESTEELKVQITRWEDFRLSRAWTFQVRDRHFDFC